jgi:hypothetical protein
MTRCCAGTGAAEKAKLMHDSDMWKGEDKNTATHMAA